MRMNSSSSTCADGTTASEPPAGSARSTPPAADMGGMGFISGNHAQILHNSLINLHTLEAARVTRAVAVSARLSLPQSQL
jgi:hypothetical protein